MSENETFQAAVTVRHDDEHGVYEYGFEKDGAFVPIGIVPTTTVDSHVTRQTDTEREQFPQKS